MEKLEKLVTAAIVGSCLLAFSSSLSLSFKKQRGNVEVRREGASVNLIQRIGLV